MVVELIAAFSATAAFDDVGLQGRVQARRRVGVFLVAGLMKRETNGVIAAGDIHVGRFSL